MKKLCSVFVIMIFGMVSYAYAATEAGMSEIQVQGSFYKQSNSEDDDVSYNLTGGLNYNYFLASNFSLGGNIRLSGSTTDYDDESVDDSKFTTAFFMLRGDLYLGRSNQSVIPYIGAKVGFANYKYDQGANDYSSTTLSYGAQCGLKFFTSENTSLNIELDWTSYKADVDNDDEITITNTGVLLGFSYYF